MPSHTDFRVPDDRRAKRAWASEEPHDLMIADVPPPHSQNEPSSEFPDLHSHDEWLFDLSALHCFSCPDMKNQIPVLGIYKCQLVKHPTPISNPVDMHANKKKAQQWLHFPLSFKLLHTVSNKLMLQVSYWYTHLIVQHSDTTFFAVSPEGNITEQEGKWQVVASCDYSLTNMIIPAR